ncbi:tetraspanin-7-like [Phoenix dactylifera]|uniref:Tetraspanin-7-like n=1 Tax=Phoenix dactylifera TaxID=42345 RepID=A0A8B8ZYG0_PHODC|nr:tetraspanin-7-like [Phoenix dactylifera]
MTSQEDCDMWQNDPFLLCYDCNPARCVLDNIKNDWKRIDIINIIALIFLIIVYSIRCYAFRNNTLQNTQDIWKVFHLRAAGFDEVSLQLPQVFDSSLCTCWVLATCLLRLS